MLKENAITKTKDILITFLKGFLFNESNYVNMGFKSYKNFEIFDKEPKQLRRWPSLLMTSANGNFISSGLSDISQEIYDENGICIAYRYSGILELPITLEIATLKTRERDELSDLISIALRVLLRRQLEEKGILIKNDVRYSEQNEIVYDSNKVYISTIQFTAWSEWYNDVSLLDIKQINLNYEGGRNNESI